MMVKIVDPKDIFETRRRVVAIILCLKHFHFI